MKRPLLGMRLAACAVTLFVLSGCNDSVPRDHDPPTPPASVEGIATPASVAVVTATNAD